MRDEDRVGQFQLPRDLHDVLGVPREGAVPVPVVGRQVGPPSPHVVEQHDAMVLLERRHDEPPHLLVAPEPVREHHRTAVRLTDDRDGVAIDDVHAAPLHAWEGAGTECHHGTAAPSDLDVPADTRRPRAIIDGAGSFGASMRALHRVIVAGRDPAAPPLMAVAVVARPHGTALWRRLPWCCDHTRSAYDLPGGPGRHTWRSGAAGSRTPVPRPRCCGLYVRRSSDVFRARRSEIRRPPGP